MNKKNVNNKQKHLIINLLLKSKKQNSIMQRQVNTLHKQLFILLVFVINFISLLIVCNQCYHKPVTISQLCFAKYYDAQPKIGFLPWINISHYDNGIIAILVLSQFITELVSFIWIIIARWFDYDFLFLMKKQNKTKAFYDIIVGLIIHSIIVLLNKHYINHITDQQLDILISNAEQQYQNTYKINIKYTSEEFNYILNISILVKFILSCFITLCVFIINCLSFFSIINTIYMIDNVINVTKYIQEVVNWSITEKNIQTILKNDLYAAIICFFMLGIVFSFIMKQECVLRTYSVNYDVIMNSNPALSGLSQLTVVNIQFTVGGYGPLFQYFFNNITSRNNDLIIKSIYALLTFIFVLINILIQIEYNFLRTLDRVEYYGNSLQLVNWMWHAIKLTITNIIWILLLFILTPNNLLKLIARIELDAKISKTQQLLFYYKQVWQTNISLTIINSIVLYLKNIKLQIESCH